MVPSLKPVMLMVPMFSVEQPANDRLVTEGSKFKVNFPFEPSNVINPKSV
jgi:hypothetical protein